MLLFPTTAIFSLDILQGAVLHSTSAVKPFSSSIDDKVLSFQRILKLAASSGEDNKCSGDITKILEYLKMGAEDIERTPIKDIVIVVGPSGVGKSTLTQFVGNRSNTLRSECLDGRCKIIDESGTIGDEIISKTFLPNLVYDNETETPFYDMPGFQDNRDPAIEIANSFFIQQVIEESDRVKILVLAKSASFSITDKSVFIALIKNMVDLIKRPEKFVKGAAIIATMADKSLIHKDIVSGLARFLKCDVLDKVEDIFGSSPEYIDGAKKLISAWIPESLNRSCTPESFSAKYVSYFRTPANPGPLENLEKMKANKRFLETLLWTDLEFIPKDEGDFGLPLSVAAIKLLEDTGTCIAHSLSVSIQDFIIKVKEAIMIEFSKFTDTGTGDFEFLSEILTNLTNIDLDFSTLPNNSSTCLANKLLEIVENLQTPFTPATQAVISDSIEYFKFIEQTSAVFNFQPDYWVAPIKQLQSEMVVELANLINEAIGRVKTELDTFSKSAQEYFISELKVVASGNHTDIPTLSDRTMSLRQASYSFADTPDLHFTYYIDQVIATITPYGGELADKTVQKLGNFVLIMETLESVVGTITFFPTVWVEPLKAIVENVVRELSPTAHTLQTKVYDQLVNASIQISEFVLPKITTLDDIYDKQSKSNEHLFNVMNFDSSLNELLRLPTATLHEVMQMYSLVYGTIQDCKACYSFPDLENVNVFEILSGFNWRSQDQSWTYPLQEYFKKQIQREHDFTLFLIQLYTDLTLPTVQASRSELHDWWLAIKNISEENIGRLFTLINQPDMHAYKLFENHYIQSVILESESNTKRLELLLNTTIEDLSCPSGTQMIFRNNFLSLKRIKSCLKLNNQTDVIAAIASHTIFLDEQFVGKEINTQSNVDLLLLTSEVKTVINIQIDLSGGDAPTEIDLNTSSNQTTNGIDGSSAGTFYLLHQTDTTKDKSVASALSCPNINGGKGSPGSNGKTGSPGLNGGTKSFNAKTNCEAWLGGDIQIRVYPNSCNSASGGTCHAGDYGVWVNIYGNEGTIGGRGGNGGNGSSGGAGGQCVIKNIQTNLNVTKNGNAGENGSPGPGGDGGLGGQTGNTLQVLVDDVLGWFDKVCTEYDRDTKAVSNRAGNGPRGSDGIPVNGSPSQRIVDATKVKTYFAYLKEDVEKKLQNEFMKKHAMQFLAKLNEGIPI